LQESIESRIGSISERISRSDFLSSPKCGHLVQFYDSDDFVLGIVSSLAAHALDEGDASVIVATTEHLDRLERLLEMQGTKLEALRAAGRYVALDAAATLSQFMVDGWPDDAKFNDLVGGVVRSAIEKSPNGFTFAFGEMVALLCAAKQTAAAVRLEQLWNSLAKAHRFSLYCAYPMDSFGSELDLHAVLEICAEHSLTIPAEGPF
jgi:MEDS: MEthanogen/methylotroph, DcmR Sensory domain